MHASEHGLTSTTKVPLYWVRYGPAGSPSLVLHGGPGAHHDYLLPQMLRLAERRGLLFYDQQGGGRSKTDSQEPIGWRTHVADLARILDEFRIDHPTLIGYSWGGLLALLYALEAVEGRTAPVPRRLVLIDPAPLSSSFRAQFEEEFERRQRGEAISQLRDALLSSGLRESDPAAYRQRLFEIGVAGYFATPARARDLTPFRLTGRVQQSVWESLGEFDLIPRLNALTQPTLIVHGWHDPIPVESSLAAARAMTARCVVLEASGHVPYVEQPDALFGAIEQFLQDTSNHAGAMHDHRRSV